MNEVSVLVRETPESSLTTPAMLGHRETTIYKDSSSHYHQVCQLIELGLLSLQNYEKRIS